MLLFCFLTAKDQESDKLMGLMAGGDDYLVKPFSYAELLGRVKALLRRYKVYNRAQLEKKNLKWVISEKTSDYVLKFNESMDKGMKKSILQKFEI